MIDPGTDLVTVFGGSGFIGRYICENLLKRGVRVRVASREPRLANHIQPLGQVGQFGFVRADVTRRDSVRAAVEGASAVVNLVGILKGPFHAVHVTGARCVAEAARDAGAKALVHVSAIGADPASPGEYGRTKAEGEQAVRAAFPKATIFRPSVVFGPEDQLTNRFAQMARLPVLPVIAAKRKFQPVYVKDLAGAIAMATLDPETYGGKTFEIGGPQVLSMEELYRTIIHAAGEKPELVRLPDFLAAAIAWFGFIPGAPITWDQWLMLQRDNVPAKGMPGLEAFGITPTPLGAVAPEWLNRFAGSRFARRRVNITAS